MTCLTYIERNIMRKINYLDKEKIIRENGEEYYNVLISAGEAINKVFRENDCKNNDFMKRMYEKRDKLREEQKEK